MELSSDPSRVDTRNYADKTIYRGETGITGIQVSQLSFFIKKMTISFACPNPRDFEQTIQPIFLRHGQFCAVEFGWGMRDTDIKTPPLSLDDIQKLNSSVKERNLASAGNYQCDVGIVSNYTFSLNTDGGYEGTIDILTRGQNVLNQTSQSDIDLSRDVLSVQTSLQNLRDLERLNRELSKEEKENLSLEQNDVVDFTQQSLSKTDDDGMNKYRSMDYLVTSIKHTINKLYGHTMTIEACSDSYAEPLPESSKFEAENQQRRLAP